MRYFLTTNASHPAVTGGFTFVFEPVQNRGGSWLGVLAVEEDSAASTLASAGLVNVAEISFERYDSLKKKVRTAGLPSAQSASPLPRPRRTAQANGAVAGLAGRLGAVRGVGNPMIPNRVAASEQPADILPAVSLQSTSVEPPAEPLLDAPADKPARYYGPKERT
jgi:hypothetical protein